jgi:hypothetical protein
MGGKIPKKRVKAVDQGEGRGKLVPISRSQIEEAGLDPDEPLEVNRYVYDTERAEIRLRLYPADAEDA